MSESIPFTASLNARDLAVARGGHILVEDINLSLAPGEAIVLRGANGAGKTTLLRTLAGLLSPAAGEITISTEEARLFCGTLNSIKAALSVDENLKFWAALYGTSAALCGKARAALELDTFASRPAGQLSTGYSRRLGLARLVVANRPIWFIDEPTSALDSGATQTFEALLANHRAKGGCAIIATHDSLVAAQARVMELST